MQSEPFKRLIELVAITGSCNEIACGEVLADHFAAVLLPHDETIVLVDKQYFTDSGRTDIVVIGDRTNLDGTEERLAYVWELKAPQMCVFKKETNSRVCPSEELYSAENQLLHYHASIKGSDSFRDRWSIARHNVKIGGIVIGTQANFIDCAASERTRTISFARTALAIREQTFYSGCGLRLWTWDTVLRAAPRLQSSHQRISVSE